MLELDSLLFLALAVPGSGRVNIGMKECMPRQALWNRCSINYLHSPYFCDQVATLSQREAEILDKLLHNGLTPCLLCSSLKFCPTFPGEVSFIAQFTDEDVNSPTFCRACPEADIAVLVEVQSYDNVSIRLEMKNETFQIVQQDGRRRSLLQNLERVIRFVLDRTQTHTKEESFFPASVLDRVPFWAVFVILVCPMLFLLYACSGPCTKKANRGPTLQTTTTGSEPGGKDPGNATLRKRSDYEKSGVMEKREQNTTVMMWHFYHKPKNQAPVHLL